MSLRVDERQRLAFSPRRKSGDAARVVGDVVWESSDPETVSVHPDLSNPLQAVVLARRCGAALITARATVEVDEGTREVVGVGAVAVIGPHLAAFDLSTVTPPEVNR